MKALAIALILLALVNAGLANLLPLRGQADAAALQKEAFGKLGMIGDALDVPLAAHRTEASVGRGLEPGLGSFAEWLTEERGRATLAFHHAAAGFLWFNSVAFAACASGAFLISRRRMMRAESTSTPV